MQLSPVFAVCLSLSVVFAAIGAQPQAATPVEPLIEKNSAAAADSAGPANSPLQQRILAAKDQFRTPTQSEVAARQARLKQVSDELGMVLLNSGPAIESGWKDYLRWTDIQESLNDAEKVDPARLQAIVERLSRNHNGLERPRFTRVRDALRAYARALAAEKEARREGKAEEVFARSLETLAKRVDTYRQSPTGADSVEIIRSLNWLHNSGQATELVTEIENGFSIPNLQVQVTGSFLTRNSSRPIDRVSPVCELILGTRIRGTAHTVGMLSSYSAESQGFGLICLNMNAVATSCNVGVNGPATIYTTGHSNISASKAIFFSPDGIMSTPAQAHVTTHSTINDIETKLRIINRIAWKRAMQQKPQAEAIASRHAEQRVAAELDREVATQLAEANQNFRDKVRTPIERRGLWPQKTDIVTSGDGLNIAALYRAAGQVGAHVPPHSLTGSHDVVAKLHETGIANMAADAIGGMEVSHVNVAELLLANGRTVPEELKVDDDTIPWSFTFDSAAPVTVEFKDNLVNISLWLNRFRYGEGDEGKDADLDIENLIHIRASYHLYQTPAGPVLRREDGDLKIEHLNVKERSNKRTIATPLIRRKFAALLEKEIPRPGEARPSLIGSGPLAGQMKAREISAHNGWLVVGLDSE